jgi:hypothetical protein
VRESTPDQLGPSEHSLKMNSIKDMERPVWARPRRQRYPFIMLVVTTFTLTFFTYWAFAGTVTFEDSFEKPLRFTENGTFQISIFEDLHFGEGVSALVALKNPMLIRQ